MKNSRKEISVNIHGFYMDELEGRVVDTIRTLQRYVDNHGDTIRLSDDGYAGEPDWNLSYSRDETDDEMARRIKLFDERRVLMEAKDKKLYEELKAKYGSEKT